MHLLNTENDGAALTSPGSSSQDPTARLKNERRANSVRARGRARHLQPAVTGRPGHTHRHMGATDDTRAKQLGGALVMDEPVHSAQVSLGHHILNWSPSKFTERARNALAIPQAGDNASAEVHTSLQPTFLGYCAASPHTHAVLQMREHERLY